jgi:hypothetical protein
VLGHLQRKGLVRKRGDLQWELVDPEGAALAYSSYE